MAQSEINLKTLLLAVAVVLVVPSLSQADGDLDDLANSNNWRTLLHFRDGDARVSEIDEPGFFLSRDGRRDPRGELDATLAAFRMPAATLIGRYNQHARCAYPARFHFLRDHGFAKEFDATEVECPELNNWKQGLAVDDVALVYASPYLGNPASMFGHTFLRLKSRSHPLVDASVSFDATPSDDGAIAFALKGLLGGYRGLFSQQPFYAKVKTYSEIENRGLWEYELKLSKPQIERLVEHLWEMGGASFDYYFFDENCSYQLLSLLEVAEPAWHLRQRFSAMTVPLDTVRAVESYEGAVATTSYREPLVATFERRFQSLSASERFQFEKVRRDRALAGGESAATLDALIDWQKYQTANRAEGGAAFSDELETRILVARTRVALSSTVSRNGEAQLTPSPPEKGHASSKASLGWLREGATDAASFEFRPALHDRLDADLGYVRNSTLVIGRLSFAYFAESRTLSVREITFAQVENLRAMNELRMAPSWVVAARLVRPRDLACLDCVAGQLEIGFGASAFIFRDHTLITSLANVRAEDSNSFRADYDQTFRFNPSLRFAALTTLNEQMKFEISAEYFQPFARFNQRSMAFFESEAVVAVYVSALSFEFRASLLVRNRDDRAVTEPRLMLGQYF